MNQLPGIRGAGKKVDEDFVEGEKIVDDVNWKRAEEYDALSEEMIELYFERKEASETEPDTDLVKHFVYEVYVQRNKNGIDIDMAEKPLVTIAPQESLSVVHHFLDPLKGCSGVCITGQTVLENPAAA